VVTRRAGRAASLIVMREKMRAGASAAVLTMTK
jgi:hypothetical protein